MDQRLIILLAFFATVVLAQNEQPSTPTVCNGANQGRCECGDQSQGFTTYTFWVENQQRCFTVYQPESSEPLPVMIFSQCYGKDKLSSIAMDSVNRLENQMARRYKFARIGISTPDGNWKFGNDGIVNDDKPMPCSDEDSKDMIYARAVFEFIKANPDKFDPSRIWTEGFSQNSMFSAYIGFCFGVNGVVQGGSGMALTGKLPHLPGCEGQVTASDFQACRAENKGCEQCIEERPCTECQYWPIYPCYSPKRPIVDCLMEYTNDPISVVNPNGHISSELYMYEKLVNEGHDVRLLRFDPSEDETISGGHSFPQNKEYWKVGCLGVTAPCSQECEDNFVACVEVSDISTAQDQARAFQKCMQTNIFTGLTGCTENCAPTFGMLTTSEMPSYFAFENFGAGPENSAPAPPTSLCQINI